MTGLWPHLHFMNVFIYSDCLKFVVGRGSHSAVSCHIVVDFADIYSVLGICGSRLDELSLTT